MSLTMLLISRSPKPLATCTANAAVAAAPKGVAVPAIEHLLHLPRKHIGPPPEGEAFGKSANGNWGLGAAPLALARADVHLRHAGGTAARQLHLGGPVTLRDDEPRIGLCVQLLANA